MSLNITTKPATGICTAVGCWKAHILNENRKKIQYLMGIKERKNAKWFSKTGLRLRWIAVRLKDYSEKVKAKDNWNGVLPRTSQVCVRQTEENNAGQHQWLVEKIDTLTVYLLSYLNVTVYCTCLDNKKSNIKLTWELVNKAKQKFQNRKMVSHDKAKLVYMYSKYKYTCSHACTRF